jgi:hypothetical protein
VYRAIYILKGQGQETDFKKLKKMDISRPKEATRDVLKVS